jgi:hypothetical protein
MRTVTCWLAEEAGCTKMQKRLERTVDERTSSTCAKSLKSSSCAKEIEEQANYKDAKRLENGR